MNSATLPLSEALSVGLETTVIGLSIVFSVLIILMLVLMVMKKIFYKEAVPGKITTQVTEPDPVNTNEPEPDEGELIAVLTAAVAASLNTSTYNLRIKSYRRTGAGTVQWRRAGIEETIGSRL